LCADEPAPLFSQSTGRAVLRADFESEPYFGPGWSGPQRTGAGTIRQASDGVSTLLLPLDSNDDYQVTLNIEADRGTRLSIAANGKNVGTCELGNDEPCEMRLPRVVLRNGVNWIALATSSADPADQRLRTMTFRGARLQRSDGVTTTAVP
jgi:hypothetical protein